MREILGRRRRLLSRWNIGLRSGGNDERSGGTGSAPVGQAGRTDASGTSGTTSTTGTNGNFSTNGTTSATGNISTTSATGTTGAADLAGAVDKAAEAGRSNGAGQVGKGGGSGITGGMGTMGWGGKGGWLRGGRNRAARGSRNGRNRTKKGQPEVVSAALTIATEWQWPVLPGVGLQQRTVGLTPRCACPDPECTVPGAHPFDPGLLAATTDERMVRWWWTNRPTAPVILATGGRAPCAVSLPAVAAARALVALDQQDIRLGPVLATPTRWSILVAPYSMEQLGELLFAKDFVPGSLRFHGEGGYLALPPSDTGQGQVRWERAPLPGSAAPWVPDVEAVVDAVVRALTHRGVSAPEM